MVILVDFFDEILKSFENKDTFPKQKLKTGFPEKLISPIMGNYFIGVVIVLFASLKRNVRLMCQYYMLFSGFKNGIYF